MPRALLIILTGIIQYLPASAQTKEYKLLSKSELSNFNYKALDHINTYDDRTKVFKPVKGKFTVYTFIADFRGISRHREEIDFHDILIVKTDKSGKILDAYQYTLEWGEMPLTFDLFRSKAKNISLTNGLSLDDLMLERVWYDEVIDKTSKKKELFCWTNPQRIRCCNSFAK
jgi:hypothetical protein